MIRAYLLGVLLAGSPMAAATATGDGGLSLDTLVQTGVTGTLAAVLLMFARTAYAREVTRADRNEQRIDDAFDAKEMCNRESARADREAARADREAVRADKLDAKLDELNEAVLNRYAGALAEAARAVADATTTLSRVR